MEHHDSSMRWASALSEDENLLRAFEDAAGDLRGQLGERLPDLVLVFVSPHHRAVWDALPRLLARHYPKAVRIGCSGGGVIGDAREVEDRPALSLTAACLPGVELQPFHLPAGTSELGERLREPDDVVGLLLLPEPFSCDVESLLVETDLVLPRAVVVGGLASGAREAGENMLLLGDELHEGGTVGVALSGQLEVDSIVAQGCRPIGNPMFVTACEGHLVLGLDGRSPVEVLKELLEQLSPRDQELLGYSLFLGLVMRDAESHYSQGDFLIRNVIGIDPSTGVLAVGATPRANQVVQFHLRDAEASAGDLRGHLEAYRGRSSGEGPRGALLFSCLGRGQGLFGQPHHDSRLLQGALGPLPVGGFFCSGEIGQVQGETYLHGYTSSVALFRVKG